MKILKKYENYIKEKLETDYRYQSDEQIEDSFRDWKISDESEMYNQDSGTIILERPYELHIS